ncbi:MAG: META domain-containing protein [Lysobacterales bacterium]
MRTLSLVLALLGLSACSSAPTESTPAADTAVPAALQGLWYWTGTQSTRASVMAADPARYTLQIAADGSVQVRADCNNGRSSAELTADAIRFGPVGLTKMGCAADTQDRQFLDDLAAAERQRLDQGRWLIELGGSRGTMQFAREPSARLRTP